MKRLISSENKTGIYNLLFRVLTIAAKFVLSILIVKRLSVADYGTFGIFQTTVTLAIYVLGFDFYTYNTRQILKANEKSVTDCLMNQLVFHGIVYLIVLPLLFFVFFFLAVNNSIPTSYKRYVLPISLSGYYVCFLLYLK